MRRKIEVTTRRELTAAIRQRYQAAQRITKVTGYHRANTSSAMTQNLRYWRHLDQVGGRHGKDEVRDGWRRCHVRCNAGDRSAQAQAEGHCRHLRYREHAVGQGAKAGETFRLPCPADRFSQLDRSSRGLSRNRYPPARKARAAPRSSRPTFSKFSSRKSRTGTRSFSSGFKPVNQA